jgi:hypothetical protein
MSWFWNFLFEHSGGGNCEAISDQTEWVYNFANASMTEKRTYLRKKCRFGGSKMRQQQKMRSTTCSFSYFQSFRTRPFPRTRTQTEVRSPKFGLGLGLGLKKSWLSYTLTQNYQSMKYLWRFNYSKYMCMWFIKGIIGFFKRKIWNFGFFLWNVDFFTI